MYQKEFLIENNLTHTKRRITEASWKLLSRAEREKWTLLGEAQPKVPLQQGQESFVPQKLKVSTPPLEVVNKGGVEKNPAYTKQGDVSVKEIVKDNEEPIDPKSQTEQLTNDGADKAAGTDAAKQEENSGDAGDKKNTVEEKTSPATTGTGAVKETAKSKNPNRP